MHRDTKPAQPTIGRGHSTRPRAGTTKGLSVAIIGAGRLGTALGLALKAAGYQIDLVVAQRPSSAQAASRAFGSKTLALSAGEMRTSGANQFPFDQGSLVLISTPDDAIEPLARQLSKLLRRKPFEPGKGRARIRRVVLHTSGALSSDILKPMRNAGFAIGSLHPLLSISDSHSGAKSFKHAFFSIEGDPAALRVARALVRDLAGESFKIDSDRKALYHAAAVMASPHMTALFDVAVEMLGSCGLSSTRARRVLLPLLASTVKNLHTHDATETLTGTFKRGDVATVRKHLAAIKGARLPAALLAYIVLGQRSVSIVKRRPPKRVEFDKIAKILARTLKEAK